MRLLKTGPYIPGDEKLEVIQKWGKDIPPYAILSHTWSADPEDEVLLSDIKDGTCNKKPAFGKLAKAMERAKLDGYGWLWIDTCCIDKTSSVELSEAINSMYGYYKKAQKCYTYLADVSGSNPLGEQFRTSRWWKRGWTLQELLAPSKLEFFSAGWDSIGYKDSLHQMITEITGIEEDYLAVGAFPVEHASVAKRMSWAASRETTREEDMAYALIGIFDVNMPMLYGEGATRAFMRLQEEILKSNEDQSLFAWVKSSDDGQYHGLLADSPKDFEHTGSMKPYTEVGGHNPSNMTARGLNATIPLTSKLDGTFVAALRCPVPHRGYNDWIAVYLQRLTIGTDQYARVQCDKLVSVSEIGRPQQVYIRQTFPNYTVDVIFPYHFIQLRSLTASDVEDQKPVEYKIINYKSAEGAVNSKAAPTVPGRPWSMVPMVYLMDKRADQLTAAFLMRRPSDQEMFVLMFGTSAKFEIGIDIHEASAFGAFAEMEKLFSPQRSDQYIDVEWHSVRVSLKKQSRLDQLIYFVDMEINSVAKPPTAEEMLKGAVDVLVGDDRRAAKQDLRGKVKRLWKTPGS